jgi:hypothetical protein
MLTVDVKSDTYDLTTLKTVKDLLKVKTGARDFELRGFIRQASSIAAKHCKRVFAKETVTETLRCVRKPFVALQRYPVSSIISVTADGSILASSSYEVDSDRGMLYQLSGKARISWCYEELIINYVGGYDLLKGANPLPDDVEKAALELVKAMYHASSRDPAVKSEEIPGVMSKTYYVGELSPDGPLPPLMVQYLEQYVRHDAMFDE